MVIAAGNKIYAADLLMTAVDNTDDTSRTTTSTSFTSTLSPANICGVAFTAPPSGKVMIHINVDGDNSGAGFSASSLAVRKGTTVGSGDVVLAASFATAIINYAGEGDRKGICHKVEGLTGGDQYNAYFEHVVDSGTGTFRWRSIQVDPKLA